MIQQELWFQESLHQFLKENRNFHRKVRNILVSVQDFVNLQ